MDGYERLAEIAKVLGHPTRLQILQVLRVEEACVCHLEAILGQRQAYISQHLMRLREAGLVVDRREGMNVFYALADESLGELLDELQETAAALGGAVGETLVFPTSLESRPVACTCPKCLERDSVVLKPEATPSRA